MTAPPNKPVRPDQDRLPRYTADAVGAPLAKRLSPILLQRYAVEREIGRGGAAFVFLARDPQTGQRIAIKVLRSELLVPAGAKRFQREIEIVRSLEHPNILPLLDFGDAD